VPGDIYKPTNQIIHMLVEIVCKGGNYLLNIGPSPEGEWADTAYIRLQEIGDWMKINGAAIYNSRPIEPFKSGNVCFTSGIGDVVYAIYLAEPGETTMPATIRVSGLKIPEGSTIGLLGKNGNLGWKHVEGADILVTIPRVLQNSPPCKHAWTFRIQENKRK